MRVLKVGVLLIVLFGLAAEAATAGCMATVGLAPPPTGMAPNKAWNADITVLQHGVRPLPGATPRVTIVNVASGERRQFAARPTRKTGVYRASVVFPAAGEWRYEVYDGFVPRQCAQTHTFDAVTIGGGPTAGEPTSGSGQPEPVAAPAPAAASDGGVDVGRVLAALGFGALALALAGGTALTLVRRNRSTGARA
jgi:YtkA-like